MKNTHCLIWKVSDLTQISCSLRLFSSFLVTVPTKFGITITFMFYSFCNYLARSRYLLSFSLSLFFHLCSAGTTKSMRYQVLLLSFQIGSNLFTRIGWFICIAKTQRFIIIIIIIIIIWECYTPAFLTEVWVTSSLSILADLNNTLVWMVFSRSLISKFSCPCTNPLVTVPSVPVTIGITVTFMFHSFFSVL